MNRRHSDGMKWQLLANKTVRSDDRGSQVKAHRQARNRSIFANPIRRCRRRWSPRTTFHRFHRFGRLKPEWNLDYAAILAEAVAKDLDGMLLCNPAILTRRQHGSL
jgi:hypothetical protein